MALGDIIANLPSLASEIFHEDAGGAYAVGIVVTVYYDCLMTIQRLTDPLNRFPHIQNLHWIIQIFQRRMQKMFRRLRRVIAAANQDLGKRRIKAKR